MTKQEVIEHLCATVAVAYKSMGDYQFASDGFCHRCPFSESPGQFRHEGKTLSYVRRAVVEQLKRDGFAIAEGFDPISGDEVKPIENKI